MSLRWTLPILKYEAYSRFMKSVNNSLAFGSSDIAQFRLRCIKILEDQGYAGINLAFPGVSRRSVFRWRERYLSSEKKLTSLIPRSTRPLGVRQMVIPSSILGFIKKIREEHPKLSKYKIKIFLDDFCVQNNLPCYSASWIGKVIKKHSLFFKVNRIRHNKKRMHTKAKIRVSRCPKQADISLGYLQADGIKVCWNGQTCYFLSAIELTSRQAFIKRVPSISSYQAKIFLIEIKEEVNYLLNTVQTDNGSEFHKYFDEALTELSIAHLWSYPHSPKANGYIERFNGVIQQEFVDYHIDTFIIDKTSFDQKLSDWIHYYNNQRPHHSLALQTPSQRLLQLQNINNPQSAKCV